MSTHLKGLLLTLVLCASLHDAYASGPSQVAKADFSLWPLPIENSTEFDTASRAELIVSGLELDSYSGQEMQPSDLGIKKIHPDSLSKWQSIAKQEWLEHFKDASANCHQGELACGFKGDSWESFIAFAMRVESQELSTDQFKAWLANTQLFYASYLKEQLRLAALFPSPTSEILKLDPSEMLGDELKDREFLLTFDDGPTPTGGYTERYMSLLGEHHMSVFFFTLGNALERRLGSTTAESMHTLYENQCLASHGYIHKPHPRLPDWQESLTKTSDLVKQINPEIKSVMFRPPYGQRQIELVQFLSQSGSRVILWNIDSQDWSNKISAEEVKDRIKKLMLLKRHGIILFHDVHPKGLVALPDIFDFAKRTDIHWMDCHDVKPVASISAGSHPN